MAKDSYPPSKFQTSPEKSPNKMETEFKRSRILIVDDQIANICLLQNILSRVGYVNVKSITDSREVFDEIKACEPDLIILDLMMPHMDGFQVMQQLGTVISADN